MKINSIRISNILSFEFKNSIDECQEIKFDEGLNIIIGPNGAGKSNFLEIINQVFHNILFVPFNYNEATISSHKTNSQVNLNNALLRNIVNANLPANNKSNSDVKQIKIVIGLNENDKTNLKFLNNNNTELVSLSQRYSNSPLQLPVNIPNTEIDNFNEIELLLESRNNASFTDVTQYNNNVVRLISIYLQMFNLIQYLIIISNNERRTSWVPLKNTFAIIGGYRNYNQILTDQPIGNEVNDLQNIKQRMLQETTRSSTNEEPVVFSFVRHKLCYDYHRLRVKIGTPDRADPIEQFDNPIFKSLNEILELILNIRIYLSWPNIYSLNKVMNFLDTRTSNSINVTELSAGEKGIIHFIFSIYGFDLENGVMIIDEPELHLHPQIQQKYIDILNQAIDDMKIQFIVATHSPILINSKTINNVKRFYKNNGFTQIVTSQNTPRHHNLIKFLDYTKATQIMFSNHVLMVEGESDAYVFQHYYEKYKERNSVNTPLNFIHIVGKDSYTEWKRFFDDWKITTFFIRDLDDFGGGESEILQKRSENIYILRRRTLEDYIGNGRSEKFRNAVDFCENRYASWIAIPENSEIISEWDGIFSNILSKL